MSGSAPRRCSRSGGACSSTAAGRGEPAQQRAAAALVAAHLHCDDACRPTAGARTRRRRERVAWASRGDADHAAQRALAGPRLAQRRGKQAEAAVPRQPARPARGAADPGQAAPPTATRSRRPVNVRGAQRSPGSGPAAGASPETAPRRSPLGRCRIQCCRRGAAERPWGRVDWEGSSGRLGRAGEGGGVQSSEGVAAAKVRRKAHLQGAVQGRGSGGHEGVDGFPSVGYHGHRRRPGRFVPPGCGAPGCRSLPCQWQQWRLTTATEAFVKNAP